MSVMPGYGSTITEETMKTTDTELIQDEVLSCEVFFDRKRDILTKSTTIVPSPVTVAAVQTEEDMAGAKDNSFAEGSLQKSGSFGCLGSVDYSKILSVVPCFLGVTDMNLEAAFQMRRAYSEGDIQVRIMSQCLYDLHFQVFIYYLAGLWINTIAPEESIPELFCFTDSLNHM